MVKMMAKRGFYDSVAEKYRPTGEQFVVDDRRSAELVAAGVAEVLEASADSLPAEQVLTEPSPVESTPPADKKPKRKKG